MTRSNPRNSSQSATWGRRTITILLSTALAAAVLVGQEARGQIGGRDLADANLTDAERRESTLLWLNTFLTESELLRQQDVDKIRQAVGQMTPSQLERWLQETRKLREFVESERWQETKRWLREFMRVQNMYSEPEIQKLRDEIVQADADQLLAILKRIQAKHDSLVWMQQASDRNRQIEVQARDNRMAQQAELMAAARQTPTAPPLFGNAGGSGGTEKVTRGYQIPAPLITSNQMARAAVWSELWGPGWMVGF